MEGIAIQWKKEKEERKKKKGKRKESDVHVVFKREQRL
jgi:hypothetical protein